MFPIPKDFPVELARVLRDTAGETNQVQRAKIILDSCNSKIQGLYLDNLHKQAGKIMELEQSLRKAKSEENNPPVPLRVISGGMDGDGNWLSKLPDYSIFLCRPKSLPKDQLFIYVLVCKTDRWARLETPPEVLPYQTFFVDHSEFSKNKELFEVMYSPE